MSTRLWRVGFVAAEVMLLASVPVLAYQGFDAVLDTTDGRVVDPELDPEAPGYEAFVEATPTLAVLGRSQDGALSWIAVLVLSGPGDQGGSVLFVPVTTLAPDDTVDLDTLAEIYRADGADATALAVADIFGAAMGAIVEIDDSRLTELLRPVSPLSITNPDELPGFAAGELSLDATATPAFLAARSVGESDLTRLARHEEFWRAWLAAIGASADPDAVPGEIASGVGRFLRGLAAGPVTFDVPPVAAEEVGDGSVEYRIDAFGALDLAEERIPFPAAPRPGARPRVRVLDGVGAEDLALRTARDVIGAGGQVVVAGNADRFDATVTRVVYFEPAVADRADAIAVAFGVEAERLDGPNPDDAVDITVVAGSELMSAYGLTTRLTTGESAGG